MTRTEERGLAVLEIFAEAQQRKREKPIKREWTAWDPPPRQSRAMSLEERRAHRRALAKKNRVELKAKRAAVWAALRGAA